MPTAVGAARGPRHVFTERCMTELCMADPKSHRTVPGDPPGALHARWVHQGRGTAFPGEGKGFVLTLRTVLRASNVTHLYASPLAA